MNLDEIKLSEGFKSKAYKMQGDRWTFGYGSTFKLDGTPVKEGDFITKEDAEKLLLHKIQTEYLPQLTNIITAPLNENQKSALVSLIYNIGSGNLRKSALHVMINNNPHDPNIRNQWHVTNIREGSQFENGLRARRIRESNLYFS